MPIRLKWLVYRLISFSLLFWLFSHIDHTHAFEEYFTVDPNFNTNWLVENNQGLLFIDPGITLSAPNGNKFPYLYTSQNVDLSKDDTIEIRFRYLKNTPTFGAGIALTDNIPQYGPSIESQGGFSKYTMFYIWGADVHLVSSICPKHIPDCNSRYFFCPNDPPSTNYDPTTKIDLNEHVFVVEVVRINDTQKYFKVYLDNILYYETSSTIRDIKSIWIGHPEQTSTNSGWDTFSVLSIKSFINTPTTSPSPEPTVTPTPEPTATPQPSVDPYPQYYSQLDSRWAGLTYDSAESWASDNPTIGRWGCALTSAAMVLKNYGVKMPGPGCKEITPENLNNWLKSQSAGYIAEGRVNWNEVARFAKYSKMLGCSPTKLEYQRTSYSTEQVLADLKAGYPVILREPNHFVLAYAEYDGDNWLIADPNSSERRVASKAIFDQANKFVPSKTDLSYLIAATTLPVKLELMTLDGLLLASSDENEVVDEGQPAYSLLWFGKPDNHYLLKVRGPVGKYLLELYLYDQLGRPMQISQEVEILSEEQALLLLYDKQHSSLSQLEEVQDSFESIVWQEYAKGNIRSRWTAKQLIYHYSWHKQYSTRYPRWQGLMKSWLIRMVKHYPARGMNEAAKLALTNYLICCF